MSWVTVLWSGVAAACLTLAVIHLTIGLRQRRSPNVLFALTSLSVVGLAGFELALMRSVTPGAFGTLVRWFHVPIWVLHVTIVLLVRGYLRAGRPWLAAATILTRSAALIVNFVRSPNLNYAEITGIRQVSLLGEPVSVGVGTVSGWTRLGQLSSLLLLLFLLDAIRTVWKRNERGRAILVGGSMFLFVFLATAQTALVHAGILEAPYVISLFYFGVIAAMSYDLTSDVVRADALARTVRQQDAALREVDRRLELGVEAADMGFWTWHSRTGELWMTARGRELRGFGPEERLDIARFFASIHSEDRDAVRRAIDGAIQGSGSFELEYRVLGPDGKPRWVALRGASENDASGGVVLRGVSIDITRRKQAETEARTRELEMAHLARATLLGELSGSLAHELNQPLTAILSNAQAAQRLMEENRETREEIREIFAEIIAEDKRAGDVIRKLRGLLKKGEVHVEALDVAELGDEVLRLMHSDFVSHGVNIETDFPAGLPRIAADRVQIVQVLVNLAANACDAMDDRPSEARRLLLGARVDGDGVVCTSVTDNGPGIASDDFARLFQPFVTTKKQGMGLGLAICRTIVTAHGGRIWATNNADGGASFHFTLPTAEPAP